MSYNYINGPELTEKQKHFHDLALLKFADSKDKYPRHHEFKLSLNNNTILINGELIITAHYIADITVTLSGNEFRWAHESDKYPTFVTLIKALKRSKKGIFRLDDHKFPYLNSELWFIGKIIDDIGRIRTNQLAVDKDTKTIVDRIVPESLDFELLYLTEDENKDSLFIVTSTKKLSLTDKMEVETVVRNIYNDKDNYVFFPHHIKTPENKMSEEQKVVYKVLTLPRYLPFVEKFIFNKGYVCKLNKNSNIMQFMTQVTIPKINKHNLNNLLQVQYEAKFNVIFAYTLINGVYKFMFDLNLGKSSELVRQFETRPALKKFDSESELSVICYAGHYSQHIIDESNKLKVDVNDVCLASFEIGKNTYCFGLLTAITKVEPKLIEVNINIKAANGCKIKIL